VREITIAGAGQFELIDPKSSVFASVRAAIEQSQSERSGLFVSAARKPH
jgi:hypothetical protein